MRGINYKSIGTIQMSTLVTVALHPHIAPLSPINEGDKNMMMNDNCISDEVRRGDFF
jgi:hypothetical protein